MARHLSALSPSIEQRIVAWQQIQRRLLDKPKPKLRPTVTLSRAFGCEGFPLAERLRKDLEQRLGEPWLVYDKALLEEVAKQEDLPLAELERLGDVTRDLEGLGLGRTDYYHQLAELDAVARRLVQVAQLGNAVIVGRGGAALTRGLKNCFRFRLDASLEYRVRSMASRLELDRAEAEELVRVNSRERDRFVSERFKVNLADISLYDAVFNNERHSVAEISAAIVAYVQQAWPEPELFARHAG